ncbi:hypothetical protein [Kitasatospora sp. NPDC005856]|uniref:phage baseplate protein n=1 Tax=Kitasatospora sp. NPDC005856 TaxID=3154566 RepID=UPI0033E5C94B
MISRRTFALGSGAAALAAAFAGGSALSARAFAATGAAQGALFDLDLADTAFLAEKPLRDATVMQSFAFDNVNGHIYAVQLAQGSPELSGDLCITKLTLGGTQLAHMYLRGFGHGVSIGVEPAGSTTYLWTETNVRPESGYGRNICRFPFVAGTELSNTDVTMLTPVPGSTANQPGLDMLNRRLVVRHKVNGSVYYDIHDLDAAIAGDFSRRLYHLPQAGVGDKETFQGFTLLGDHLYQLTGDAYTDNAGTNPPTGHGNTYLSTVDITTGALVQRSRTEAGYNLTWREPEGMAVQLTSPPRLFWGIASGLGGSRKASLYYKPMPMRWYLSDTARSSTATRAPFSFGNSPMIPLAGSWDGTGGDSPGAYEPATSTFHLSTAASGGTADLAIRFGDPGDVPVVGRWDGGATTGIGVYRPSNATFYLRHHDGTVTSLRFGDGGNWKPVAGDWTHKGYDTPGLFNPDTATFYLLNTFHEGAADTTVRLGDAGDLPLTGDWNASGTTQLGVYRPTNRTFYFRAGDGTVTSVTYGDTGMTPITGDWNNDGITTHGAIAFG